jgi:hypothetical protein
LPPGSTTIMDPTREGSITSTAPPSYTTDRSSRTSRFLGSLRTSIGLSPPAYEPGNNPPRTATRAKNSRLRTTESSNGIFAPGGRNMEETLTSRSPTENFTNDRSPPPVLAEKGRLNNENESSLPSAASSSPSTPPDRLFNKSLISSAGHPWATLHLESPLAPGCDYPTYQAGSRIRGSLKFDLPKKKPIDYIELVVSATTLLRFGWLIGHS